MLPIRGGRNEGLCQRTPQPECEICLELTGVENTGHEKPWLEDSGSVMRVMGVARLHYKV